MSRCWVNWRKLARARSANAGANCGSCATTPSQQRDGGLERLRPIVVREQLAGLAVVVLRAAARPERYGPRRDERPQLRPGEQQAGRRDRRRRQHPGAKGARLRGQGSGLGLRAHADRLGQRGHQLPRAAETLLRIRLDRRLDHVGQRLRQIGPHVEQRAAGALAVRRAELLDVRALDGVAPRQQVEDQHADGVDVARDRRRLSCQELRRHVRGRAARVAVAPALVGEPEIHQQDPAALLAHDVAGLDVAVHESRGVDGPGRPADVDADECRFARAHGALRGQDVRERLALDEVAPEAGSPLVLVDSVDRHDVRVPHPRHRPRFLEQCARLRVAIESAVQQQLQGDVALERRVEGAVDLAERAAPHAQQVLERPPALERLGQEGLGRRARLELGFVRSVLLGCHGTRPV